MVQQQDDVPRLSSRGRARSKYYVRYDLGTDQGLSMSLERITVILFLSLVVVDCIEFLAHAMIYHKHATSNDVSGDQRNVEFPSLHAIVRTTKD